MTIRVRDYAGVLGLSVQCNIITAYSLISKKAVKSKSCLPIHDPRNNKCGGVGMWGGSKKFLVCWNEALFVNEFFAKLDVPTLNTVSALIQLKRKAYTFCIQHRCLL